VSPLWVGGIALVLTWILTGSVRRYALQRGVLDLPNTRSSHEYPVPRGGGLAIVAVTLGGVVLGAVAGQVSIQTAIALVGGGGAVAWIGWVDDRRGLAPMTKAAVQVCAAIWTLAWLGGLPELRWGGAALHVGVLGWALGTIGIVWGINFYNFMDGIDGLAAGEAVTVSAAAILLLGGAGPADVVVVGALVGGSSAGFLLWNWPPARVFLGDVGSAFLGFLFAALAVMSENSGALPVAGWLLLLGVFFADASLTVARRIMSGEPWYRPHRSHAYQRAVQAGLSHRRVTLAVMWLNLVLAGLAWAGVIRPARMPAMIGVSGIILLAVYLLVERWRPMYPGD
jgi:Fuc2NAc and GlcNAc transferase